MRPSAPVAQPASRLLSSRLQFAAALRARCSRCSGFIGVDELGRRVRARHANNPVVLRPPLGVMPARAQAARAITIYRDAGCGYCLNWVAHARRAGFATRVIDTPDMAAIKRRLGVPAALWACHTAARTGLSLKVTFPWTRHGPAAEQARQRPRYRRFRNALGLAGHGIARWTPSAVPDSPVRCVRPNADDLTATRVSSASTLTSRW